MGFNTVSTVAQKLDANSEVWLSFIHKTSCPDGSAGDWIDLSMAPGTPKYNAYVGDQATFTPLNGVGNDGIYTGESAPGKSKYLASWWMQTMSVDNVPATVYLLDYVGFYPMIDLDSTDPQYMDNTVPLPRYTDGRGLRMFLVATISTATSVNLTIKYTNQDGISGRTSSNSLMIGAFTGNIISTPRPSYTATLRGPFCALDGGDIGVRSVEEILLDASAGGFGCLVLAKPIAQLFLGEMGVVSEIEFWRQKASLPKIEDSAYLNMIAGIGGIITPSIWRGGITIVRD